MESTEATTASGVYASEAPKPCVVIFADIVDSTGVKESQTETAWVKGTLLLYAGVYSALVSEIRDLAWVKFLGDAAMIVVPVQFAAEALNSAIRLLELINDANRAGAGAKGEIDFNITIGVATGPVVEVTMPDGRHDFIGHIPDRASRLAGVATPNALLVDAGTVSAANMTLVTSRVGRALDRPVEDYLGDRESVKLRGFAQNTNYHEIQWSRQFFGVKAEQLTSTTARLEAVTRGETRPNDVRSAASKPSPARGPGEKADRRTGTIRTWNRDGNYGFVTDSNGEEFHVSPRHLVYQDDIAHLAAGQKVAFVAGPAPNNRSREALAVLLDGREAQGYVSMLAPDKPYGWIKVVDMTGAAHPVFVSCDDLTAGVMRGSVVDFRVEATVRGARATAVQMSEQLAS
jgi:class 3 adenylate cyclase/cold shock CspA family protein